MLEKLKVYHPDFPKNEFEQAIDLADVSTVRNNGGVLDLIMHTGEKVRVIREGVSYSSFVDKVNDAKLRRYGH